MINDTKNMIKIAPSGLMDLENAARFANAVGALAVTKKGPMEGAPTLKEVNDFIGGF